MLARAAAFMQAVGCTDAAAQPVSAATDRERPDAQEFVFSSGARISIHKHTGEVVAFLDVNAEVEQETGRRLRAYPKNAQGEIAMSF